VRRGTVYAVTNDRILICRSGPFSIFVAMALDRLPEISISERAGGRGTIRFGQPAPSWVWNRSFSAWAPSLDATPQFIGIDHAREVFDRIQLAARGVAKTTM
jgi:hypothetical protein